MTSDRERCTIPSAGQPVSGVMSRALLRIDLDATLEEARDLLAAYGVHHLLVFESERLVGVISDRDVLSHISRNLGTLAERRDDTETLRRRVFHAASYKPVTVPRRAPIAVVSALMLHHKISCVPVTDEQGKVVDVVRSRNLLGALSRMPASA